MHAQIGFANDKICGMCVGYCDFFFIMSIILIMKMTLNDLMTSNLLVLLQKVGTVMTLSVLTLTPPRMKKVLEGYSAMKERFANVPGGTFLQYGAIYI